MTRPEPLPSLADVEALAARLDALRAFLVAHVHGRSGPMLVAGPVPAWPSATPGPVDDGEAVALAAERLPAMMDHVTALLERHVHVFERGPAVQGPGPALRLPRPSLFARALEGVATVERLAHNHRHAEPMGDA